MRASFDARSAESLPCAAVLALALPSRACVLSGKCCDVGLRQLHGLLNQRKTVKLALPCHDPACHCAVPLGGKNRYLATAARLAVVLAHQRFMRGEFRLNLGAVIARSAIKLLLCIFQLVRVQPQLGLGNLQLVTLVVGGRHPSPKQHRSRMQRSTG